MYRRQRILLGLLDSFGGTVASTDFQKYLFLYTRLCESRRSYEFVPYKYGCYSFQSVADKTKLINSGFLENCRDWRLSAASAAPLSELDTADRKKLELFAHKHGELKGRDLLKHVYKGYPWYASNSLVAEEILAGEDLERVKKSRRRRRTKTFATIGYEGLQIEEYINKLLAEDIRLLVDVRKNPLSRKYGFSKNKMKELTGKVGIEYIHMPELGIVSDKRKALKTRHDYEMLFREYEQTTLKDQPAAVLRLLELYEEKKRVAITCFEECHTMCHRHKVADAVRQLDDGSLEITNL